MEKRTKKLTLIKTRNSEFERYESDIKILWLKYSTFYKYLGQHESADQLEQRAKFYIRQYGMSTPVNFDIRTGTGIVVEYGTIFERGF